MRNFSSLENFKSFCTKGLTTSRPKIYLFVAVAIMATLGSNPLMAQTVRTVGSGGNYTNLTTAFTAVNGGTLTGDIVFQIISSQTLTSSAALNASGSGSANYTSVIIYPTAAGLSISSNINNQPTINLNGADNVIIDGRVNQLGTTKSLIISSTRTSGFAVRFIGDASANTLQYCQLKGVNTSGTGGVVTFSTGTTTGNDNNTIDNCDVTNVTSLPVNGIYSAGSSAVIDNSNNTVSNCNISNYFGASTASNGIFLSTNNSAWTITDNRFFQTAARQSTTARLHHALYIASTTGVNFTISNNIIGYATNTGTGLTSYTGTVTHTYRAIELNVGTATPSSIQGNTITAFSMATSSGTTTLPGIFSGISILGGSVNIGTVTGNTIGATTGNGAITITTTTSLPVITGIYGTSTGTVNIQNNNMGSISTGTTTTMGYTIRGIYTVGIGTFTISDNTIGSTSTTHSIAAGRSTTGTAVCTFSGIYSTSTGVNTITNNTIQNCTAYGTGSSIFYGIVKTGGTNTLSITGNSLISSLNNGTGAMIGIYSTSAASTLAISNNIIRDCSRNKTTGTFTGIYNTGAVTSAINIDNNLLGNVSGGLITYSLANSSALLGISNTAGTNTCALSIQNNDIRGITQTATGTNAHTYIINSAATLSQNISNNTFTNLSTNTTGTILFLSNNVIMPANGVQHIDGNSIVTGFTRTAASGALTLFTSTASTASANVTVTNNNNDFSNINLNGTATIAGWINTDAGAGSVTKTIDGNTFSNWTAGTGAITAINVNIVSANNATSNNSINTISGAGTITAITTGAGNDKIYSNTIHTLTTTGTTATINGIAVTAGTVKNVYQNTIYNLQANNITTGSIRGIAISAGTTNNVYRNNIYSLTSSSSAITSGTVNGILISGTTTGQTNTIHNNMIGDLRTTAASSLNAIMGLSVANTGTTSTTHAYFNTIYLNATSSGANFGSSTVYHVVSTTATTAALHLRNNILINTSTANGTGRTIVFRRSSGAAGALANYVSTSNNNLFYAGTPSATNLIYSDGTSTAQTIALYKAGVFTAGTIAPRDQLSITEKLKFVSTNGADPGFLKMGVDAASYIESGGTSISGITIDKEGDFRFGDPSFPIQTNGYGTAPDIGADEFDGFRPHVEVASAHVNSDGYYGRLQHAFSAINAESQTGTNIQVSLLVNTVETSSAVLQAGNWTSLLLYPTLTGLSITGNLSGSPLIDLNGADLVTIDGRVNHTGSTTDLIIANSSTSGTSGTSTLRFINSAENNMLQYCTVRGSTTSVTDGVLTFATAAAGNGNDNNVVQSCNLTNAGGNRPLNALYSAGTVTFENSSNSLLNSQVYDFLNASASSNGVYIGANSTAWTISGNSFYETTALVPSSGTFAYNLLRMENSSGNTFVVSGNYFGGQAALCGGTAWSTNSATNHSMRVISLNVGTGTASSVQNNTISNWNYGSGSATPWIAIAVDGGNVNIGTTTGNTIGSSVVSQDIILTSTTTSEVFGIRNVGAGMVALSNNNIGSMYLIGDNGSCIGLEMAGSGTTNSADKNFIHTLTVDPASTTSTVYGIRMGTGAATYSNNIISLGGNTETTIYGIFESGSATSNNNLYFNTIYIGGALGSGITKKSYALWSNASTTIRDIRNNIFANDRSTTGGLDLHYAAYLNYGVDTDLNLDFNDYYAPSTGGVVGFYNGANKTELPLVVGLDAKSLLTDPTFVNAGTTTSTDYKVNTPLFGVSGTGITTDFEGGSRSVPVNMGAFEYYTKKWLGSVSTAFSNVNNWAPAAVPTGIDKVGISSETTFQPILSGTSPANDITLTGSGRIDLTDGSVLTVQSGPVLTLQTGAVVKVDENADLTFESGSTVSTVSGSKIILESGSAYVNLGTSAPSLEVKRVLTATKGWRMVSAPVSDNIAGMFESPLVTQGFTGSSFPTLQPNLLWWLESDGGTSLQSWRKPSDMTDNLVAGRGYFHYVFDGAGRLDVDGISTGLNYSDVLPSTMTSTGVENFNGSGSFNYSLTYTTKASTQTPSPTDTIYYDLNSLDQGWNLLGNPTASTLDWDAPTGWTKTNVDNAIYVWDPSALSGNGDYLTWNGTTGTLGNGRIAPFQAFWAHSTAATTLSFTNAVKTINAGTFLRSSLIDETVSLPITLSMGDLQTTSYLSFSENGATGPDRWDAYRLESMSENWLELFTLSSPEFVSPLVINHLPILKEDLITIPLYYDAQLKNTDTNQQFSLNWSLPANWPSEWNISLLNHQTEEVISMKEQSSYSFNTNIKKELVATAGSLPLPKSLLKELAPSSKLRSSSSAQPFSIVIYKGSNIEYMAPKPQLVGSTTNPFKATTQVRFSLPEKAKTRVDVFSSQGQRIATLADDIFPAGITEIPWNASNLAPGLYLIRFLSGETLETKKAVLIF